jgi:hypothetical protein
MVVQGAEQRTKSRVSPYNASAGNVSAISLGTFAINIGEWPDSARLWCHELFFKHPKYVVSKVRSVRGVFSALLIRTEFKVQPFGWATIRIRQVRHEQYLAFLYIRLYSVVLHLFVIPSNISPLPTHVIGFKATKPWKGVLGILLGQPSDLEGDCFCHSVQKICLPSSLALDVSFILDQRNQV